MTKRLLTWLAGFGKGDIYIWIKPVIDDYIGESCGRIVFLNSPLKFLKNEKFSGFQSLRELSAKFGRVIVLLAGKPNGDVHKVEIQRWIGDIRADSTDYDLQRLVEKADQKADRGLVFPWGNPNLPWDKIPRFY